MTPKEKALELVRKYYTFGINKEGQTLSLYECKKLAKISVDEILYVLNEIEDTYSYNASIFYNEVKEEIKKI